MSAVTVDGNEVNAIGRRFGGAHSDPRLPLDGTDSDNLFTSRPQELWTFGGQDAGNLLGIELIAGKPAISGLRPATTGVEGVVWTRAGHTWTKQVEVDLSLVSNPDLVVSFSARDRLGDLRVVAGDEVGLAGGLNQRPSGLGGLSLWTVDAGPAAAAVRPSPGSRPALAGHVGGLHGRGVSGGGAGCVGGPLSGRSALAPTVPSPRRNPRSSLARPAQATTRRSWSHWWRVARLWQPVPLRRGCGWAARTAGAP